MNLRRSVRNMLILSAILLAVFLFFRMSDRSKKPAVEFPTLESTSSGPTTRIIPQIAVGSLDGMYTYATIIQMVNLNPAPVEASARFYNPDGAASSMSLSARVGSAAAITFSGDLSPRKIPPAAALVVTGEPATPTAAVATAWGRIVSSGALSIVTFFEIRDIRRNSVFSRVGVPSSSNDLSRFVIPRMHNSSVKLDVAFAIVNTGSTPAVLVGALRDASGKTLGTKTVTVKPGEQLSGFAGQFFMPASPAPAAGAAAQEYQSMVFESASPQFAAFALALEGGVQTSFPVQRLQ